MKRITWALAAAGIVFAASIGYAQQEIIQPPGPVGPQRAAPGDLGMAIMSAHVSGAGSLIAGEGATGAERFFAGAYQVNFGRDVTSCVYTVTGRASFLRYTASPREEVPNGVFVASINNNGSGADADFQMIVYCGR